MKSALAIHDLSCHAASSLNVVLPVLYAAGIDTSFLPSAILSSQSDGFDSLYSRPLDDECTRIMDAWLGYGLVFDCLYSGYLADHRQVELVKRARRELLSSDALVVTDPVMGDDGRMYQNITHEHIEAMRSLTRGSTLITPNQTEACLLAGCAMKGEVGLEEAEALVRTLHDMCGALVVVTSMTLEGGMTVNMACDGGQVRTFPFERIGMSYPGSGDLFTSLLCALMLNGEPFFVCVMKATRIASHAVNLTFAQGRERREGVIVSYAIMDMLDLEAGSARV